VYSLTAFPSDLGPRAGFLGNMLAIVDASILEEILSLVFKKVNNNLNLVTYILSKASLLNI